MYVWFTYIAVLKSFILLYPTGALAPICHRICLGRSPTALTSKLVSRSDEHGHIVSVPEDTGVFDPARRRVLAGSVAVLSGQCFGPRGSATAADQDGIKNFRTGAFGKEEYTNSITASRDTNISPKEVYDSIESQSIRYPLEKLKEKEAGGAKQRAARALDVGAGAGVSTQVLWDMGYRDIDAFDWSGSAWERFVVDDENGKCPPSVRFFELDDERYRDKWRSEGMDKYDAIVFNFGVNERKAVQFAKELLEPENGRMLAPVNGLTDYWLKQVYKVYDGKGDVVKVVGGDIGAWSVQFQPDVTQDTCQGVWCAPFNGFQKKK